MSDLTRSQVEEWLRIAEEATPGPYSISASNPLAVVAQDARATVIAEITGAPSNPTAVADTAFFVSARTAVPALCRALLKAWDDVPNDWRTEAMAARAAIDNLWPVWKEISTKEQSPWEFLNTYASVRAANEG